MGASGASLSASPMFDLIAVAAADRDLARVGVAVERHAHERLAAGSERSDSLAGYSDTRRSRGALPEGPIRRRLAFLEAGRGCCRSLERSRRAARRAWSHAPGPRVRAPPRKRRPA